jgi:hypothetical protein
MRLKTRFLRQLGCRWSNEMRSIRKNNNWKSSEITDERFGKSACSGVSVEIYPLIWYAVARQEILCCVGLGRPLRAENTDAFE